MAQSSAFNPAFPAATNPVLRRPPRPEGRVWIEDADAFATVDLANASYGLMLRLLAYAYTLRGPGAEKSLTVDLAVGLMQALMPLAERAARLPAGPSNPHCNAGVSFIALRDPSPLPPGRAARRLFIERFAELREAGAALRAGGDARATQAAERLAALAARAEREFELSAAVAGGAAAGGAAAAPASAATTSAATASVATAAGTGAGASSAPAPAPASAPAAPPPEGIETVRGETLELQFEAQRCIHSRFCVTWAPRVFLANVPGAWIHPDAMPVERVVEVAHACPSGAIRYRRLDGGAGESAPPVNLASVREGGPLRFFVPSCASTGRPRAIAPRSCCLRRLEAQALLRRSPRITRSASTPRASRFPGPAEMLAVRDGVPAIDPQTGGPLRVRGNLEITSGTGRVVARVTSTYLCRCGASATKPFCDGTHAKIGFKSA